MGTTIIPDIQIRWSLIRAGSLIMKDILNNSTMIGFSALPGKHGKNIYSDMLEYN